MISPSRSASLRLGSLGPEGEGNLNDQVYDALREALICGRFSPSKPVALRPLAAELGVSPMPVREAISRLLTEQALMQSGRGIVVPPMTADRFRDLVGLRLAIEPSLAPRVIKNIRPDNLRLISQHDSAVERAISTGNVETYILSNFLFHRSIYTISNSPVLIPILDRVWLQLGPFSRVLYGRLGTATLEDKHRLAIEAIKQKNPIALGDALRDDIQDGLALVESGVEFADA